jgi:hypothetical protein
MDEREPDVDDAGEPDPPRDELQQGDDDQPFEAYPTEELAKGGDPSDDQETK